MGDLEKITYLTSLIVFYLKGVIYTEKGFLKFKQPNTIFGIIPLGQKEESILLKQIVGVNSSFKFEIGSFLIGLLFIILGLPTIILSIIGILVMISSFQTHFEVSTTGSAKKHISFIVFDNNKMHKVKEYLENVISSN